MKNVASELFILFTIDNGNSNPHVGIFEGNKLKIVCSLDELTVETFKGKNFAVFISDVAKKNKLINFLQKKYTGTNKVYKVSSFKSRKKFLDMPFEYADSIGEDRLCQAYFTYKKNYKKKLTQGSTLLIDSGTFTTVDLINSDGFCGGYIFPGPKTFLSVYAKGANLPNLANPSNFSNFKLKKDFIKKQTIAHNTEDAILYALGIYLYSSLEKIVYDYYFDKKINCKKIILTGGFANLQKNIIDLIFKYNNKIKMEVLVEKHFIHHSLFYIFNNIPREKKKD
ncbi:MAG: type III pantothenate kinase [Oligoflexia bacterium]|nr:type III pantothenate kinase [Oligoflexia bacterium]